MSAAYLNQKRSVGYVEKGGHRHCSTCALLAEPIFAGVRRLQCRQIGVCADADADVLPGAHCRAWKGRVV
jgi:hypothetical protein